MGNQFVQHPINPVPGVLIIKRTQLCNGPKAPHLENITAIEPACQKLEHQEAEELRADDNRILRSSHAPKPNLTKGKIKGLAELR